MSGALSSSLFVVVAAAAAALSVWAALRPPDRPGAPPAARPHPPSRPSGPPGSGPPPASGPPLPSGQSVAGAPPEPRIGKEALRAASAAGAGVAGVLLVPGTAGLVVAAGAAAVVWWRSTAWDTAGDRRRRERIAADLPHVVDLMVAALEAGASPPAALDRVVRAVGGPVAEELRVWLAHLGLGSDPAVVWKELARHPELGRLGRALHRATESGAPVSAALVRLSEELRARARSEVETRVRAVEVKAALPLAVCLLPAFLLLGVVPLVAGSVTGGLLAP